MKKIYTVEEEMFGNWEKTYEGDDRQEAYEAYSYARGMSPVRMIPRAVSAKLAATERNR